MGKPAKIALSILAAGAIFALGVEYSPQVMSFINRIKRKPLEGDIDSIKKQIEGDLMKIQNVFDVTSIKDKDDKQFIRITVKDQEAKSKVEEYLSKKSLGKTPISIVIGQSTKTK